MRKYNNSDHNFVPLSVKRELDERYRHEIQENFTVTHENIRRLGLYAELQGHSGCVNCLEWNESGDILASGSDDVQINLWDPMRKKLLLSLPSGHHGNIFSVKFVPNTRDRQLISGAADHIVRVHDVTAKEVIACCSCHAGRVKRIVTDPTVPSLFFSSGEDGIILQHDLRTSHSCSSSSSSKKSVLVDLKSYFPKAEAKCLAINPIQPEYIAVGANDPYVRMYDRRMIKVVKSSSSERPRIPLEAVQYFVPGHLPTKMAEFKRSYRSVASTFVSFSPNGKELLVNLGGEQIYLFPTSPSFQKKPQSFIVPDKKETGCINGYNQKSPKFLRLPFETPDDKCKAQRVLSDEVEAIKLKANEAFEKKKYPRAIHLYNEALQRCPTSPILYGNRAAALLKRNWDGDVYVAFNDCLEALRLDPGHYKAHLRMCRCLYELNRLCEAEKCLQDFKERFPSHAENAMCKKLESDLVKNLKAQEESKATSTSSSSSEQSISPVNSSSSSSTATSARSGSRAPPPDQPPLSRNYFLRFVSSDSSNSSSVSHENLEEEVEEAEVDGAEENSLGDMISSNTSRSASRSDSSSTEETKKSSPKSLLYPEDESILRSRASDFSARFCGHCNTTTDIKEANFFGNFIVAGSDDGSFFIWDRKSSNIVRMLKGDKSIVNCLNPQGSTCVLATSGIESVVRIWAPLPESDENSSSESSSIDDIDDAAISNQKRMTANPGNFLNLFLGSMGNYDNEGFDEAHEEGTMQCNST